jgi:hypothetical protein
MAEGLRGLYLSFVRRREKILVVSVRNVVLVGSDEKNGHIGRNPFFLQRERMVERMFFFGETNLEHVREKGMLRYFDPHETCPFRGRSKKKGRYRKEDQNVKVMARGKRGKCPAIN